VRALRTRLRSVLHRLRGDRRSAALLEARRVEGWLCGRDATILYDAVATLDVEGDVVEIGSWKGRSTVLLARAIGHGGRPRRLYAVDPHEEEPADAGRPRTWEAFRRTLARHRVEDVVEPVRVRSPEAASILRARGVRVAFLYVDGSHEEEDVLADVAGFAPLLVPGARVAFDDAASPVEHPGVQRALARAVYPVSDTLRFGRNVVLVRPRVRLA
jgi:predicted O-methyltransferase YrrM